MQAEETSSGDSDKALLARHVAGDPDAFGELVRRHRDRLWAVALRTLGDREEAADAVQDALVSAYRAAHTFRGQSAVTTWLHRITVNACLDRARKTASRKTSPIEDTERLEHLLEPHEAASVPAERKDLSRELLDALRTLPAEQRAALVLVDMHGYPVAEAAGILDVATGTVKSRCARGRARLLPLLTHLRPGRKGRDDDAGRTEDAADDEREAGSGATRKGSGGRGSKISGRGKSAGGRGGGDGGVRKPREGRNRTQEASVPPAEDSVGKESHDSTAVKGGGGRA
ncbi:RNA polymerase sigma factor SigM [Streptomyces sulfonofaciens]|uniref:RNA polymerase sigma factor SigM n=1 Tax=Streptomyces sulfonofaciens TaxID=68272 RepID=A0A919KRZ3_9ACTN|nr:RNA polymerase sigma factor SigM [Streptomyces sulfonofaciens]GHH70213.1 RNA polymerase sigma factor SigM [Streptomyces sulfonofaciens]